MVNSKSIFDKGIKQYCIDTNVFIDSWFRYYSPDFCMSFWEVLLHLSKKDIVFIPREVFDEVEKKNDELFKWIKMNKFNKKETDQDVIECWRNILDKCKQSKGLVSEGNGHSLADPWVISHAMNRNATVVTNEKPKLERKSKNTKIQIPDVCKEVEVECIDIFSFIREVNIKFDCQIGS